MAMGRMIRVLVLAGMGLGLAVTQSGCLIAAAAAGTGAAVAYVRGDLETTLPAPPEKVVAASKAAVEDLHLMLISSEATGVDGKVIARTAQDNKITITVQGQPSSTSKVSIRVGTFGDQDMSQQVLDKIKAHLQA